MTEFKGTYFDGNSSRAYPVTISFDEAFVHISGQEELDLLEFALERCIITPPLGNTRRAIRFPNGARCETDDLDAVRRLDKLRGTNFGMHIVTYFESRWKMTLVCLACLILSICAFIKYGIPFVAEQAAAGVPMELAETISNNTLEALDDRIFEPSALKPEKIGKIVEIFLKLKNERVSRFKYRLEFRNGSKIGPNAFALPSGLIIITDQLVELTENDDELVGVFIHEITHVEERHGLRYVLQNAGVFLLVSTLVGDVSSITSTAATLPTILVESGYSRQFEREADEAAGLYLITSGIGTKSFQDILVKIAKGKEIKGVSMFSSHPDTAKRVKNLQELEKTVKKGASRNK